MYSYLGKRRFPFHQKEVTEHEKQKDIITHPIRHLGFGRLRSDDLVRQG
jgi:hypothetical protein